MRFVLDATAIRSGVVISGQNEWYTSPTVMEELRKGRTARNLNILKEVSLSIVSPRESMRERIRNVAETTGDISRLSKTDIDVLALALELKAIILTDDYSIQNVARLMSIEYESGTEAGIKEVFYWGYRCRGCGRTYDKEEHRCPICGSGLKMVRNK